MTAPTTLSLQAYRAVTSFLGPVARLALARRLRAGKEDPYRISEREGFPGRARPDGTLMWIHGASVGEALSVLPLVERLSADYPSAHFLVTTGTVTSARLMVSRLPERAFHQFIPVDQPGFVRRFLDHWRPDCAVFVESELWPCLLGELRGRAVPAALINGRLSPKSYEGWKGRRKAARALLDTFEVIAAQDDANAARLADLSGRHVLMVGNLKRAAAALPIDDDDEAMFRAALGSRPVWLAASTHAGEEDLIISAHQLIKAAHPDLLTIIAPRHPERGNAVGGLIRAAGIPFAQRSQQEPLSSAHEIYLADTLGELGLFYRLAQVAFIGGSLVEVGGHNPMEPARLGTAIVTGPHVFNFVETFNQMREAGALALVRNDRDLVAGLVRLLNDERTRHEMADKAEQWAKADGDHIIGLLIDGMRPVLPSGGA